MDAKPNDSLTAEEVDLTYLSSMCDGDKTFMRDMIASFIEEIPLTLNNLSTQLQKKDWETLGKLVHKMKPAIQFMGLKKTYEVVKETESNCKNEGKLEKVPQAIGLIICNIQLAIPVLRAKLDNEYA
jgi:HPt (histidine-containing phosphotransfer) domain-containing protein